MTDRQETIGTGTTVHRRCDVTYLTFEALEAEPWLVHAFSTRLGGVSRGDIGSMNLSFERGDDPDNVRENYRRIADAVGFDPADIVMSDQTHTVNVRRVGRVDRGAGLMRPKPWHDVDALITDEPGVILTTFYADCVPVYLADTKRHAIGLVHAGWRGTAGRISREAIRAMGEAFGTVPSDLIAVIGPSICRNCYEVSEEVALKFPAACFYKKADGHYQLDLQLANRLILMEEGLAPSRIRDAGVCTCCRPDFLFSHRASGGKRGNLAAFLGIVSP